MSECKFKFYALSQPKTVIRGHRLSGQKKALPEGVTPGKSDKNRLISHYPAAMWRDIFILSLSRSSIVKKDYASLFAAFSARHALNRPLFSGGQLQITGFCFGEQE
ncbi:hypothetical protein OJ965_18480 [Pantoea anthophila]|uniref:hypothetical protein n=1 Tax=Pantoea anthophila TaxID=470931 RepID=UPI0022354B81|nr:hypothetical protein [Pantoea anthophila]UZH02639.1 hypothetical protein OJ965_18480 [Pantoea anthophila]